MITEILNNAIETRDKKREHWARTPHRYYPSAASVRMPDGSIEGTCLRKEFYSMTGVDVSNHPSAKSIRVMEAGKRAEEIEIDAAKTAGIFKETQTKFQHLLPSGITVSGALDGIFILDGRDVLVEIKSIYGSWPKEHILGIDKWNRATSKQPSPRTDHLLQCALYLDHYKGQMDELYLMYIDRGSADMREYKVTLDGTGHITWESDEATGTTEFSVSDIYATFEELDGYIERDEIPPRSFTKSHWLCKGYCQFRDKCWRSKED